MKRLVISTGALVSLLLLSLTTLAQSTSREELLKQLEAKHREFVVLEKEFLSPSAEDQANCAGFLSGKEGGLIRLLPRETYDFPRTKGPTIRGGGAYYSFTRLTHEYGYGSDITLEQNRFSVGFAGANFGMIASLGDVPLAEISLSHPATRYLVNFETPLREPGARVEQQRSSNGVIENGIVYKRDVTAQVNSAYVLRSVNYSQADVLVAFRVVRQDADGSLIILWTLLKKYPVPELIRQQSAEVR